MKFTWRLPLPAHAGGFALPWSETVACHASLVAKLHECLLLMKPVAGLTDEETLRTAELKSSLAGDHTVCGD